MRCRQNPNQTLYGFGKDNSCIKKRSCNQYSKAIELGLPKPEKSIESRQKTSMLNRARTKEFNKELGKKVSIGVNKKVANNEWHTSLAKKMHYNYNGIDLHGSWELKYAKYLDLNHIKWIRCKESFIYEFENKTRRYTPDFYLIESDEYIEIKGYKTDKDIAKWEQFPKDKTLTVLMKKELLDLQIAIK